MNAVTKRPSHPSSLKHFVSVLKAKKNNIKAREKYKLKKRVCPGQNRAKIFGRTAFFERQTGSFFFFVFAIPLTPPPFFFVGGGRGGGFAIETKIYLVERV